METICGSCTGDVAKTCAENLGMVRQAIDDAVEETMSGTHTLITMDGETPVFTPVEASSALVLRRHALMRALFVGSLSEAQTDLGCTLTPHQLNAKLED